MQSSQLQLIPLSTEDPDAGQPEADSELRLWPSLLADQHARLFDAVKAEVPWQQQTLVMFGRPVLQPRLSAWLGDPGCRYRYSGSSFEPLPWTTTVLAIRRRVAQAAQDAIGTPVRFNSVLCNLYRGGRDSMGWHSDDELELGPDPVIASVSLGETRRFRMRRKDHRRSEIASFGLDLASGSVLLMSGAIQRYWQHSVPKTARAVDERINLTFRWICPNAH